MSENPTAVDRARDYYNFRSADEFYFRVWGGEDIHVGIYEDGDSIAAASRRTVERMISLLGRPRTGLRALDVGAGYGGTARLLAGRLGWRVDCLNISLRQNRRTLQMAAAQGLEGALGLLTGDFEQMPLAAGSYHVVWAEDSLVHSARRRRVLEEMDRVLSPGGEVLMSDIMESGSCPRESLGPILARIELDSLGSFALYRRTARELGWRERAVVDLSEHLATHYQRVLDDLVRRDRELSAFCDRDYLDNMRRGLRLWVDAGRRGYLQWGLLHFSKPE